MTRDETNRGRVLRERATTSRAARRALGLVALLGVASLFGCVTNPVTGRPEFTVMSPAQEAAVGREESAKVEAQIGLVRDRKLTEYVDALGQRVARQSPRKEVRYRFFVADMPEPNAFALPGGYIYVSRGLLVISNSEDELAGVIGHEIGHVAARHSAQRQTRAMGVGLLAVLGQIAGATMGSPELGQMVGQAGQVLGAGLIASYSRDQERQADQVGQDMAAAAGFDPAGVSRFLRTLSRDTALRLGKTPRPTFLDSHPGTQERVQTTAARARTLSRAPGTPIAGTRAAYFDEFDGILIGPDPKVGVFVGQTFLHPQLDFAIDMPQSWQTVNQESMVAALSPRQDALLTLEIQPGARDPESAARAFFDQTGLVPESARALAIGGFRAYSVRTTAQSSRGPVVADLTFIAHPRGVFRLSASSAPSTFERNARAMDRAVRSFRRLGASERSKIRERRLSVVRARGGESIRALSARTGNVWSVEETAVANGMDAGARLRAGDVIKIAIERPYR